MQTILPKLLLAVPNLTLLAHSWLQLNKCLQCKYSALYLVIYCINWCIKRAEMAVIHRYLIRACDLYSETFKKGKRQKE